MLRILLLITFSLLCFNSLIAKDIPILVISPGKSLQSKNTVGSDVEIINSQKIQINQYFIGDILDNNLNGMNYFQQVDLEPFQACN